jgi:thymidylate synthase
VVTIYDGPRDLLATSDGVHAVRDIPCTLSLQFMWTEGERLGLRVSMRSNDVWLGLPYDLFQFTALQCAMADALGVEPGPYVHTVGSLHLYARDEEASAGLGNPGEPLRHETTYARRWGGSTMGDISARARAILAGRPIDAPTEFEFYLTSAMEATR